MKQFTLENHAGIDGVKNGSGTRFVTGIIYISTELVE
jgi:hypothetical protein